MDAKTDVSILFHKHVHKAIENKALNYYRINYYSLLLSVVSARSWELILYQNIK